MVGKLRDPELRHGVWEFGDFMPGVTIKALALGHIGSIESTENVRLPSVWVHYMPAANIGQIDKPRHRELRYVDK
jgi:hypothetical protein